MTQLSLFPELAPIKTETEEDLLLGFKSLEAAGVFEQRFHKNQKLNWDWELLLRTGLITAALIDVSSGPLPDANRNGNQRILDRTKKWGFEFHVDLDQVHGEDGLCIKYPNCFREFLTEAGAWDLPSFPLEIGFCDETRIIRRLMGRHVLFRWPNGSRYVYALIANVSRLWDIFIEGTLDQEPEPATIPSEPVPAERIPELEWGIVEGESITTTCESYRILLGEIQEDGRRTYQPLRNVRGTWEPLFQGSNPIPLGADGLERWKTTLQYHYLGGE